MIAALAARYLLIFAVVLAALSAGAYVFLSREYASLLLPALGTPEAQHAYAAAMRRVLWTIVAVDVPLLALFAIAGWLFAASSLRPLLQARARERAFAADAAHALRSPLATIASLAQAARAEPESSGPALETILRSALDASVLVGKLLTLSRAARPELLVREPVDLGGVVAAMREEFSQRARDRGVAFDCIPRSALVDGDATRLREAARNLLENALRHARTGVRIESDRSSGCGELRVVNDGDRIPDEERPRIFERFVRSDGDPGGSGLGLAIVAWIARAHRGSALVRDCASGNGTEFVIRIPLLPS